ncbi:helix-turn-helix transcriptional regulator [Paenibacillus lactis]|uniref:Transcriptional regulator with XRE-family HTH domain n=1 Tax=Paenibacillus lactis TaxID=228574 RepID=A0ABS4F9V1_9BACL|nr:helix-turn-helix transcriptional regulator [Paenibacillus lactis]MBP1893036.1 transcriptional regulator with XRE-family HTH domain [Paenibacillus lactis]HAF97502.1 transcriptional regulator [Paenibacillus lactis]
MIRTWLATIRETKNKSQEEVAEEAGITRQYYGMIESGQRNPSVRAAQSIGKALDFNWTLFFEQESNEMLPINNNAENHIRKEVG